MKFKFFLIATVAFSCALFSQDRAKIGTATVKTLDGKNYRIYTGDLDAEKMVDMMSKSQHPMPNAEVMSKMDMKMKFYINSNDDIERMNMTIQAMGKTMESVAIYEYDGSINVMPPSLPAQLSLPLPKKN